MNNYPMLRRLITLIFVSLSVSLTAQMFAPDSSIIYGNEWIDYDKSYLRIQVAEDGMYRVAATDISAAGLGGELVLHHRGQVVPLRLNNDGSIIFYG